MKDTRIIKTKKELTGNSIKCRWEAKAGFIKNSTKVLAILMLLSFTILLTAGPLATRQHAASDATAQPQPTPPAADEEMTGQALQDLVQLLEDETENGLDDVLDLDGVNRAKAGILDRFRARKVDGMRAQQILDMYLSDVESGLRVSVSSQDRSRAFDAILANVTALIGAKTSVKGTNVTVVTVEKNPQDFQRQLPQLLGGKFTFKQTKPKEWKLFNTANESSTITICQETGRAEWSVNLTCYGLGKPGSGDGMGFIALDFKQKKANLPQSRTIRSLGNIINASNAPLVTSTPRPGPVAVNPTPRPTPRPVATPRPTPRPAATPRPVDNAAGLKQYIRGLNYDPRVLLAETDGRGSVTPLPKPKDREANGAVVVCSRKSVREATNFSDITIFRPTDSVIYPGASVYGDGTLRDGMPRQLTELKRSPIVLKVNIPGIGSKGVFTVENPSNNTVQGKIEDVLEYWNTKPASQGYVNAIDSSYESTTTYNKEQIGVGLNVDARWASGNASLDFAFQKDSENNDVVAIFKQAFYTVSYDAPNSPEQMFDRSVNTAQARAAFDNSRPPAYVSSVKYGRIILFRMTTSSDVTAVDAKAAFNYGKEKAEVGVDVKANAKYDAILTNSSIKVLVLGGNAENAINTISARTPKDLAPIIKGKNAVYSRSNPGLPIGYTVKYLKDNRLAKMGLTTEYTQEDCKQFYNFTLNIKHSAAYIGDVTLAYRVPGTKGVLSKAIDAKLIPGVKGNQIRTFTPFRSGNTGDIWFFQERGMTAGNTRTYELPGNARDIRLVITGRTGLVWDPHGIVINQELTPAMFKDANNPTGPNKPLCIRYTGTTLNRKWDNKC